MSNACSAAQLVARLATTLVATATLVLVETTPATASGATWTVTPLTIASGFWGSAESISCPTPTDCVTVGRVIGPESSPEKSETSAAAASIESAGSWSPFAAITSESVAQQLDSVSCWAAEQCLAVGVALFGVPNAVPHLIAYELDGSGWTALSPPSLPVPDLPIGHVSVSCVGPGTCRVMGLVSTSPRGATVRAYVATLVTGVWSTTSFLVPPNTLDLGPITCSSTTSCATLLDTGIVGRASGVLRSYVDWMGASGWHRTMPKGWGDFNATELKCPTPTTCVAVGVLRSGGSAVSRQSLGWGTTDVVPGGDEATSASCDPSSCTVVAYPPIPPDYGHGPGPSGTMWALQGRAWTQATIATPPGMLDAIFNDLSCAAAECTAAGFNEIWVPGGGEGFYLDPLVATSP